MKRLFIFLFIISCGVTSGQTFTTKLNFWNTFFFNGHVRPKIALTSAEEFELKETLWVKRMHIWDINLGLQLNEKNKLEVTVGYSTFFHKSFTYASIKGSKYFNVTFINKYLFINEAPVKLQLAYGFSLEALRFVYTLRSKEILINERFDEHLVPMPNAGFDLELRITEKGNLIFGALAGAYPGFGAWYKNDGVKVWQYKFEASAGYEVILGKLSAGLMLNYRTLFAKNESGGITNEFHFEGFGPRWFAKIAL